MDETLFQLSRFVFLLLLASLISFAFPILYHLVRRRIFRARPSTSELRARLLDPREKVRWAAAFSLFRARDEKSLQQILASVSRSGRFGLIQLEPYLYELSKEGIFSLEEALQHPEPEVRKLALGIAGRLGQGEPVAFVTRLLEDSDLEVRMKTLGAMVGMRAKLANFKLPEDIEEALGERLSEGSWEEEARVLQVIGAWKLEKFLPEVESRITHLHPWVRYRALETLLELGPEGKRRLAAILSEYHHIVFPILEDLDAKDNVQE